MADSHPPHQVRDSAKCGIAADTACPESASPHFGHSHSHGDARGNRLLITLAINFIIPLAQIIGGLYANSIALISDAVHNFSDFVAIFISYIAYLIGRKGVSERHTFGFQRAEIIGALLNVIILTCAVVFIVYGAVNRLFHPAAVSGAIVMVLAGVGIVGNGISAWVLHRDASHNLNVRGAFLHMMGDFLTSVVVLANGAVLLFKPWYWLDPLLSLLIAAFILKNAWTVIKESVAVLMNAVPKELDLPKVQEFLEDRPEIRSAHYLHAWPVGSCGIAFTCHITVNDQMVSDTEILAEKLRHELFHQFGIDHPIFQFETTVCGNATMLCEISDAETPGGIKKAARQPEKTLFHAKLDRWLFIGLRILIGGIFIYAAIPKILDPGAFAKTIFNYQILPEILVNPVAIVLPWLELVTGAFIILGIWLEGALIIYNLLMVAFIGALVFNTARGLDIHCGCFSQEPGDIINVGTIIRDALIFIPSAYLLIRVFTRPAHQPNKPKFR